jgi:predicted nucleic acid-binding protein
MPASYLDTSFVIPLFVSEAKSAAVSRWFRAAPPSEIRISSWLAPEFAGAIARLVRMRLLGVDDADAIFSQFDRWTAQYECLIPDAGDFRMASDFVRDQKLAVRPADALHLAIVAGQPGVTLMTLDATMQKAAAQLEIRVAGD